MNTVHEKLAKIKAIQKELEAVEVTQADRIALVTPLLEPLWDLGVNTVQLRILVPSFNDGDPCVAYVDDRFYMNINMGANIARDEDDEDEEEGDYSGYEVDDDDTVVDSDDLAKFVKDLGGTPSPAQSKEVVRQYFSTLEDLLQFNKIPVQVSLTYHRNDDGVVTEDEDWCESPY
jgi:hypothetical protein